MTKVLDRVTFEKFVNIVMGTVPSPSIMGFFSLLVLDFDPLFRSACAFHGPP